MLERRRLAAHRFDPVRVAVAQRIHTDSRAKVNIWLSFRIHSRGPFAALQRDLEPPLGRNQIRLFLLLDFLKKHNDPFYLRAANAAP